MSDISRGGLTGRIQDAYPIFLNRAIWSSSARFAVAFPNRTYPALPGPMLRFLVFLSFPCDPGAAALPFPAAWHERRSVT
jgi:hypothetical protein